MEYFCKDHNTLCCVFCTSKCQNEGYGQHFNCELFHLKNIKEEKKNKLKENINNLEELSKRIGESINELKRIYEVANKSKEELKLKVTKIFTEIRTALNEKVDKLLLEIDTEFKNIFFKEELIKESEKLPNKIIKSIEKGKIVEKEWD